MISIAPGLSAFARAADLLLVDVWGVLHDGVAAHAAAADALARYRAGGGRVVLVSNAPRASDVVVAFLDRLGFPRAAYDAVVTSGDVARAMLARQPGAALMYLGPPKDRPLFEGLRLREASVDDADVVLCAGFADDERETVDDYADVLARCQARGLRMICANPDLVVERGARLIHCAGAIAESYARMGGAVDWAGKPHPAVYDAALDVAVLTRGHPVALGRALAIGDAVRTDIAGAQDYGIRALMIAGGIHAHELCDASGAVDAVRAAAFFAAVGRSPDAVMARLVW